MRSEKINAGAGLAVFALSGLFFVALLSQAFDSGMGLVAHTNGIANLGRCLTGVYGVSAVLIPAFLLVTGVLALVPAWSPRYGVYCAGSLIPFFTIAGTENVCRGFFISDYGSLLAVKLTIAIVVCVLVVVIEYLVMGIVADALFRPRPQASAPRWYALNKAQPQAHSVSVAPVSVLTATSGTTPTSLPVDFAPAVASAADVVMQRSDATKNPPDESRESATGVKLKPAAIPVYSVPPADLGTTPARKTESYPHAISLPAADPIFVAPAATTRPLAAVTTMPSPEGYRRAHQWSTAEDDDDIDNFRFGENDDEDVDNAGIFGNLVENAAREDAMHLFDDDDSAIPVDIGDTVQGAPLVHDTLVPDDFANIDLPRFADPDDDLPELSNDDDSAAVILRNTATQNPPTAPDGNSAVTTRVHHSYEFPPADMLTRYPDGEYWIIDDATRNAADLLRDTLNEFGIKAEVTGIRKGPVITMFEILPAPGVKLSKIVALADNIALRLAASSVRIVAPIPGKHAVGIEVPNQKRSIVSFREIIATDAEAFQKMAVPVVLGKDITGEAQIIDLAKTPHMLIAGATGAGKSVCVNSLILSILYTRTPHDVKLILIDPKIVELKLYNDIPHLLTPVITEPKRAFQALQYALCEMERRYALLDGMGVRDIGSYNKRIVERRIASEKLPYIVIIIDEFADLMATTGKELESTVARLAAMSRAVGIHLVLATQRPSIDVITGLIKANIPTRVAFMVASKMDSRIIIDQVGAEKLLGKGDMLYSSAADPFPVRIQGTFVSDSEVEAVSDYVKQFGEPDYIDDEIFVDDDSDNIDADVYTEGADPMYDKALDIVIQSGKASASYIQRRLKIGYNRAARLVEEMEERGIVGPANGSKPREIVHMP